MIDKPTPKESEVMCLIAEGLTNREICNKLAIEPTTLRNHINRLFQKLDARNRAHAAARWVRITEVGS